MTALITAADLNTVINHEPRVLDTLIGERLGFSKPVKIRELIQRNKEELESYGALSTRQGISRGQDFIEYWLNEAQALLICTFSRTEKAAAVRKALIEVYQAYRSGSLAAPSSEVTVRQHTRRPTEQIPLYEKMRSGMGLLMLGTDDVLFDMKSNCLPEGGEAVVLLDGSSQPTVARLRPIEDGEEITRGVGYLPWEPDGTGRTSQQVRVLGRVVAVRPLKLTPTDILIYQEVQKRQAKKLQGRNAA